MRLIGLATYGTQITALDADDITRAVLTIRGNGYNTVPWTATFQGATDATRPSGAPTLTGDTWTATIPAGRVTTRVEVPASVREAMRTGTVCGIALMGDTTGGTSGVTPSWCLSLDYTVTR